jgi:putative membrane-bound dehydrogenase-like protein
MNMKIPPLLGLIWICATFPSLAVPDPTASLVDLDALPKAPAGFEVQIFANEPLVRNPCSMAFDARGRLCVGMGPQYRNPKPETAPDSVFILEDSNGDGIAETRKEFATGFNCIQGLAWHGRDLWVANAPDLTIARDLDGDDVADEYVRVFTDLGNVEHALHGLNWGPDGRLYMSKGNSKGLNKPDRYAPKPFRELWGLPDPAGAVDAPPPVLFKKGEYRAAYQNPSDDWGLAGGILRCDDRGANLEIFARGFRNPWDIGFDSGFHWFGTDNDQNDGDRNFMPFYGADFGWGHRWSSHWTGEKHPPTVPIIGQPYAGSGTGVVWYDAPQFPEEYRRVFFWNDWLRKTTYLYRPQWDGALLKQDGPWEKFVEADRALYRPVDIEVGPDGALWVLGWGREYGLQKAEDGSQTNEGRIYRIVWKGGSLLAWRDAKRARPLDQWTFDELADDLGSHLPVWRVNAQDELVKRGEATKVQLFERLKRTDLTEGAETWALWALGRVARTDADVDEYLASRAVKSGSLNARLQALRILGFRGREIPLVHLRDPEPRIRFEAVQAIQQARQKNAVAALTDLTAVEKDRVTFYAAWRALHDLAGVEALRTMLRDERGGVRNAAMLALADLGQLTAEEVRPLTAQPESAEIAALWLAKRGGNQLVAIEPEPGEFENEVTVRLVPGMKPAKVLFTLDGSVPDAKSRVSPGKIVLRETTTLKAVLFVNGQPIGQPVEGVFRKRERGPTMTLTPPPQPTTIEQALEALPKGDAARGRTLFFAEGGPGCVTCHRIGDQGRAFGPELTQLGERGDPTSLVHAILEPSAIITEGFALQIVTLRDGSTVAGILREETNQQLTLAQAGAEPIRVEKAKIQSRESAPASAMPPFAPMLTAEQVADLVAFLGGRATGGSPVAQNTAAPLAVETRDDRLVITQAGQPVADYVFADPQVLRPHFANLHVPGGMKVSRNFPPIEGVDATDHADMHPGLWLAFGNINDEDFWRNKARMTHVRFAEPPTVKDDALCFTEESRLFTASGAPLATLLSRVRLAQIDAGFLILWDAEIRADERELVFGDQEEMGFGARVATPLTEKNGGMIVNDEGVSGAKTTWGKRALWCDYSGVIGGQRIGIALFPDPKNPHPCWWHNRDYGVFVANPFGKRAGLSDGNFIVEKGKALQLRFAALLHAGPADAELNLGEAYAKAIRLMQE